MEENTKESKLSAILAQIELPENLRSQVFEAENEARSNIVTNIQDEEDVIAEEPIDLSTQIRKMQLKTLKHHWDESLKVTQARTNQWSKKEYDEKVNNIQYNYDHLLNVIDTDDYELHLRLVSEIDAHEDTIETLLKIYNKKVEQEEYLKENPPESFINRVAKERIEIK